MTFFAFRIIVEDEADCYKALGIVHNLWKPVPGRLKDYIAAPKTNGYRSLHTTVFSGDNRVLEFQIKTASMHRQNEYGSSAHFFYKNKGKKNNKNSDTLQWLEQLQQLTERSDFNVKHYLKELKTDMFKDRIFVMTPKGDVVDLPKGATVLDFAFAIHSDLGKNAKAGQVNGIFKALKTPLQNRDIIEIKTDKKIRPRRQWLKWVQTHNAKAHLRRHFSNKTPF